MGAIRALFALFAWFCIATTITLAAGVGWLHSHGYFAEEKLAAILKALDHGEPDGPASGDATGPRDADEASLQEILDRRALSVRDLELREQNLANAEALVKTHEAILNDNAIKNERTIKTFESQLAKLRREAEDAGAGQARAIVERMKPDAAKAQLMSMYEKGELSRLIGILTAMPEDRRAKIINEFTDQKDVEALAVILKELDRGAPLAPLIEQKQQELKQAQGQSSPKPAASKQPTEPAP